LNVILIDISNFPIDVREGAAPAITWLILHKGLTAIYTDAVMPIYNNVYGVGFSLLSIPWTLHFHDIAIAHRISNTFYALLTTLVFYQISYKIAQSRLLSFALTLAFISNLIVSGVACTTWGDAAGLLFGLLIVLFVVSNSSLNSKIIGTLVLSFIAFIVKPYYALYGIAIFIWLPMIIGARRSLKWYAIGFLSVVIYTCFSEYIFPWYLWNTVIQYSSYLGGTRAHLYIEIKAFWDSNSFWIWFLLAAVIFYGIFIKKSFFYNKRYSNVPKNSTAYAFNTLIFWVFMMGFFGLIIYYMAQNTGRDRTYFVELFVPQLYFLICSITNEILRSESIYPWLQKTVRLPILIPNALSRKNILLLIAFIISLSPGIFRTITAYSFTFRNFITTNKPADIFNLEKMSFYALNNNIWDIQRKNSFSYISTFLKNKKNVFHSPWLTNILLDNGLPIYDSSHTQHFRGPFQDKSHRAYFGLNLGRIMTPAKRVLAEKIWLNYWENVRSAIQKRKFDLIVLEDEDYSKVGYLLMFDYAAYYMADHQDFNKAMHDFYHLIAKNYKVVGHVEQLKLTIYEPREINHAERE
jgi:hypothetical protein